MYDGFLCASEGLDCAADEILPAGGEDLEVDIVGNGAGGFDQAASKVEVGLGG